ncbi:glycine-rich domain-containing protein, partial [Algoriphagus yeomjeoni]
MLLKHFLPNSLSRFIFLSGLVWFAASSNFLGAQTVTYSSPGPGTFQVPDGVTTVSVSVWGAGGGGGYNAGNKGAAGAGGGAFTFATSYSVTAGTFITYVVGSGGIGQANGSPSPITNANGRPSSFGASGPSDPPQVFANGGGRSGGSIPGNGGLATTGTPYFSVAGGSSVSPDVPVNPSDPSNGSGGGAAGSPSGVGANGTSAGIGGVGVNGAGDGGAGGTSVSQDGEDGTRPGGGGGGEGHNGTQGGNGGDGQIIITWTCSNTLTSASSTENQPACVGTPIDEITYTIVGAYGATFSNLPPGVNGTYVGGLVTISGTPTASGTFNYTVTPTGSCTSSIASGTITVTPNNTVTAAPAIPPVCISTTLTSFTHTTTGATGISNNGVAGANGLPAGVSASWNANTITISGTPTASGTFNYSIPLTGGCNTPAVNATGTITVTPNNTVAPASS